MIADRATCVLFSAPSSERTSFDRQRRLSFFLFIYRVPYTAVFILFYFILFISCCCSYQFSSVTFLRFIRPGGLWSRSSKPHSLSRSAVCSDEKRPEIQGLGTDGNGQHASLRCSGDQHPCMWD